MCVPAVALTAVASTIRRKFTASPLKRLRLMDLQKPRLQKKPKSHDQATAWRCCLNTSQFQSFWISEVC